MSDEPAAKSARIRRYEAGDAVALGRLVRESARILGATAYTPEQVAAWSRFPEDLDEFSRRLERGVTLLAMAGDEIAAFGQLDPADYLSLLYSAPKHARCGHATAIYRALEEHARAGGARQLGTIASLLSRPLFEREGFKLVAEELKAFNGVEFVRFKMEKPLFPA